MTFPNYPLLSTGEYVSKMEVQAALAVEIPHNSLANAQIHYSDIFARFLEQECSYDLFKMFLFCLEIVNSLEMFDFNIIPSVRYRL